MQRQAEHTEARVVTHLAVRSRDERAGGVHRREALVVVVVAGEHDSYDWRLVPEVGGSFTDSGSVDQRQLCVPLSVNVLPASGRNRQS
jgi:hypothetical protein